MEAVAARRASWRIDFSTLLICWLDCLAWFSPAMHALFKREVAPIVKQCLRLGARDLRRIVVAYAWERALAHPTRYKYQPRQPLRGYACVRLREFRGSAMRFLTRAAFRGMHEGSLKARLARLKDAYCKIEKYVRLILRRVLAGVRVTRVILPKRRAQMQTPPRSLFEASAAFSIDTS